MSSITTVTWQLSKDDGFIQVPTGGSSIWKRALPVWVHPIVPIHSLKGASLACILPMRAVKIETHALPIVREMDRTILDDGKLVGEVVDVLVV